PAGLPAPPPAEEVAEEVAEVAGVEGGAEATRPRAGAARAPAEAAGRGAEAADLVVLLALGLVAQDVVGRGDLLEALLGPGIAGVGVGVVLARQLPVRLGDVLGGGRARHAQDGVVVLLEPLPLRRHGAPPS